MNRRFFCRLSLMVTAGGLAAGCAPGRPLFVPYQAATGELAVVYVYRPQAGGVSAPRASVIDVDGRKVAVLGNGQYVPLALPPGIHQVTHRWREAGTARDADFEQLRITIPVLAVEGKERYVRLRMQASRTLSELGLDDPRREADVEMREVPASEARAELQGCRLGDTRPPRRADPADPELGTPVGAPGMSEWDAD